MRTVDVLTMFPLNYNICINLCQAKLFQSGINYGLALDKMASFIGKSRYKTSSAGFAQ